MVSKALNDDEKMDTALAEIERQIISGLHELGESGTEQLGPAKYLLSNKEAREDSIGKVRYSFGQEIDTQMRGFTEERRIFFFERLRKRCYDLYEMTNAWDTISALAATISMAIAAQPKNEAPTGDRVLRQAIIQFLSLLEPDMAIFQGLNRGNNHSVMESSRTSRELAQELLKVLSSGGSAEHEDGREELRKELLAEAYALHKVYCGIHGAAVALARHEETIRQYYRDHPRGDDAPGAQQAPEPAPAPAPGGPQPPSAGAGDEAGQSGHWPDHEVTRRLHDARDRVRAIVDHLDEKQKSWKQELGSEALERATTYASRLDPWESLLDSVASAYRHSKPMRLPTVRIRYCFPFAVKVDEKEVEKMSSTLKKRVPGVEVATPAGAGQRIKTAPRPDLTVSCRRSCSAWIKASPE